MTDSIRRINDAVAHAQEIQAKARRLMQVMQPNQVFVHFLSGNSSSKTQSLLDIYGDKFKSLCKLKHHYCVEFGEN